MKLKHLVTAVALIASAGAVMADSIDDPSTQAAATSGKTRAEVKAELAQARADGSMPFTDSDAYPVAKAAPSTLTRQQVRMELAKAVQNGEIPSRQESPGS